jgi:hypothetical protein
VDESGDEKNVIGVIILWAASKLCLSHKLAGHRLTIWGWVKTYNTGGINIHKPT